MLNRLFVALFILAVLGVARVYFKVVRPAVVVPVATPTVPVEAPTPARGTASLDQGAVPAMKQRIETKAVRSRADIPTETLLERKRSGAASVVTGAVAGQPLARYTNLNIKIGAPVASVRHGYLPLAARAVRVETYTSALGPVLIEENNFRVVADQSDGWASLKTSADGQPLMVNPSSGRLVLVTGTIEAAITDVEAAESLAESENLTLINFDRTIGVAFLKAPHEYALLPGIQRIGARPGVGTVELELIESRKAAR